MENNISAYGWSMSTAWDSTRMASVLHEILARATSTRSYFRDPVGITEFSPYWTLAWLITYDPRKSKNRTRAFKTLSQFRRLCYPAIEVQRYLLKCFNINSRQRYSFFDLFLDSIYTFIEFVRRYSTRWILQYAKEYKYLFISQMFVQNCTTQYILTIVSY